MVKICPYPFSRIELTDLKSYIPCCGFWLTDEYFKLDPGKDLYNGQQAQELRARILKGDYSLCNRHLCNVPLLSMEELKSQVDNVLNETPITSHVLKKILMGESDLECGPASIAITSDKRCNLSCPTCRNKMIVNVTKEEQKVIDQCTRFLKKYASTLIAIKISGSGEVFFSPWLRSLFKELTKKSYPKLEFINILTNGVLATPKMLKELSFFEKPVKELSVSIDAGDEETYKKVRGNSWKILIENLKYISKNIDKSNIIVFRFLFVVRKENYRSMKKFIKLANDLNATAIHFSRYSYWEATDLDYEKEAVFLPAHPGYKEFKQIHDELQKLKNVRLDFKSS